jgi:hypothetical protein
MGSQYLRHDHADYNGSLGATGTLVPASGHLNRDGVQAVDTRHQGQVIVQLTGAWVGTVTFQGSNNGGTNWVDVTASPVDGSAVATTATANGIYVIPVTFKDFRAQVTAYTSGTIVARAFMSTSTTPLGYVTIAGAGSVRLDSAASLGANNFLNFVSAATTNSTLVKAGATAVNVITASNNGATVAYLKLYNKATAPTVGTDAPIGTILIPINGTVTVSGPFSMRAATGLGFGITGGAAITDTTAVALSQVTLMINYT